MASGQRADKSAQSFRYDAEPTSGALMAIACGMMLSIGTIVFVISSTREHMDSTTVPVAEHSMAPSTTGQGGGIAD